MSVCLVNTPQVSVLSTFLFLKKSLFIQVIQKFYSLYVECFLKGLFSMIYILFGQCKSSNLYFQTHLHNTFRKQLSFNLICIKKGILITSFYKVEKCCCPLRPRRQERHGHGYQVGFTQQLLYLFSFLQLFLQQLPLQQLLLLQLAST